MIHGDAVERGDGGGIVHVVDGELETVGGACAVFVFDPDADGGGA